MRHGRIDLAPTVRERLHGGLDAILSRLTPWDCQTCGHRLGARPCTLAVDSHAGAAVASLHHRGCRASQWSEATTAPTAGRDHTTSATLAAVHDGRAVLIINPSMETVNLVEEDEGGGWVPCAAPELVAAGLRRTPPRPPLVVPDLRCVDSPFGAGLQWIMELPIPGHAGRVYRWEWPTDHTCRDAAARIGSVHLVVTALYSHSPDPSVTLEHIQRAPDTLWEIVPAFGSTPRPAS